VEHLAFAEIVQRIQATKADPLRLSLRRQESLLTPAEDEEDMLESDEIDEDVYSPHSACPYYIAKALSKHADLIFAPYNYILDPSIRNALDISLEEAVVVLDEVSEKQ
jgi:Rad3-related DNA helicase